MKCDLSLRRKCRLVLDGETGAIWTKITPVAQMVGGLPTLSPPSFMISDTDSCVWHGSQYSNWSYTLRSQWRIEEHSFMSLKTVHVLCNFHSCPSSFLFLISFPCIWAPPSEETRKLGCKDEGINTKDLASQAHPHSSVAFQETSITDDLEHGYVIS